MQAHPSTHPQPLLHYPQCDPSFPSDRHNPHHPLKTPFQVSHFCSGETLWVVPPTPPSFCHISCGACDSSWQSFLVLGSDGLPLRIALAATFPNVLWSWCLLGSSFQVLQLFQSENLLGFGKLEQKAHPSTELSMDIASLKNTKKSKTPKQPTTKIKSNQHPIPPTTSYCSEKCYPLGAMGFFLHRTSHAELLSPENTLLTSLY